MRVYLSAVGYDNRFENVTKVRTFLTSGVAEILDGHQSMVGSVSNNKIEIETTFDSKVERQVFMVKESILLVNPEKIEEEFGLTVVFIQANTIRDISKPSSSTLEGLKKECEKLELLLSKLSNSTEKESIIKNSAARKVIQSDLTFLSKVISEIEKR